MISHSIRFNNLVKFSKYFIITSLNRFVEDENKKKEYLHKLKFVFLSKETNAEVNCQGNKSNRVQLFRFHSPTKPIRSSC